MYVGRLGTVLVAMRVEAKPAMAMARGELLTAIYAR